MARDVYSAGRPSRWALAHILVRFSTETEQAQRTEERMRSVNVKWSAELHDATRDLRSLWWHMLT